MKPRVERMAWLQNNMVVSKPKLTIMHWASYHTCPAWSCRWIYLHFCIFNCRYIADNIEWQEREEEQKMNYSWLKIIFKRWILHFFLNNIWMHVEVIPKISFFFYLMHLLNFRLLNNVIHWVNFWLPAAFYISSGKKTK